ncbi:MAG: site-2 protease family protein [Sporolactobacillus sp.]
MIKCLLTHTQVHPIFWLVLAAGLVTGHLWEAAFAFAIVLIHEWGHASAAYIFGWTIVKIELLPFGGVAQIEADVDHPFWQESLVVLAGPLQHLLLPCMAFAAAAVFPFWGEAETHLFLSQNAAILLFNLLPIWPLDGGRLLHLFLQRYYPFRRAYERVLLFSFAALVLLSLLVLTRFPYSLNLWVVLAFIGLSIYKERRAIAVHFLRFLLAMARGRESYPFVHELTVAADAPLPAVFAEFYRHSAHRIYMEGSASSLDGQRLVRAFFEGRCPGRTIADCQKLIL